MEQKLNSNITGQPTCCTCLYEEYKKCLALNNVGAELTILGYYREAGKALTDSLSGLRRLGTIRNGTNTKLSTQSSSANENCRLAALRSDTNATYLEAVAFLRAARKSKYVMISTTDATRMPLPLEDPTKDSITILVRRKEIGWDVLFFPERHATDGEATTAIVIYNLSLCHESHSLEVATNAAAVREKSFDLLLLSNAVVERLFQGADEKHRISRWFGAIYVLVLTTIVDKCRGLESYQRRASHRLGSIAIIEARLEILKLMYSVRADRNNEGTEASTSE